MPAFLIKPFNEEISTNWDKTCTLASWVVLQGIIVPRHLQLHRQFWAVGLALAFVSLSLQLAIVDHKDRPLKHQYRSVDAKVIRCIVLVSAMLYYKSCHRTHDIIHIHNSVMWDWQYLAQNSLHSCWMWGIFHILMLVPHNTVIDLSNVLHSTTSVSLIKSNHVGPAYMCYSIASRNRIPCLNGERWMVGWGSKNKHCNYTCLNETELHLWISLTIAHSIVNTIDGTYVFVWGINTHALLIIMTK